MKCPSAGALVAGASLLGPLLAAPATAQPLVPIEAERLASAIQFGTWGIASALDGAGNHMVLWHEGFNGYGGKGFDSSGSPVGGFGWGEPFIYGYSLDPVAAAALSENRFLIVREDDRNNPRFIVRLLARSYDVETEPLDELFTVVEALDPIDGAVFHPTVAPLGGGRSVVAWSEYRQEDELPIHEIWARLLEPTGPGDYLLVAAGDAEDQWYPEVAVLPEVSAAFVWQSLGSPAGDDGDGTSVQLRLYDAAFHAGAVTQVNQLTAGDQGRPDVAFNSDGTFLVVWQGPSAGTDPTDDVHARRFDASGSALGPELRLSLESSAAQHDPRVVPLRGDGPPGTWNGYLVAWLEDHVATRAVSLDGDGVPTGPVFRLDQSGESIDQVDLAVRSTGEVLATWRRPGDDVDQVCRRFRPGLFADGFESGTTAAWSQVARRPGD